MAPAADTTERPVIETPRLRLVAFNARLARAALHDRDGLRRELYALVPDGWPAPAVSELLRGERVTPGWGPWAIVDTRARVVVGDAGFKGAPDADGVVEVGCGILPAHRGQGLATEAVRALVQWAMKDPRVRAVTAETDAGNAASRRVLEKCGFEAGNAAEGLIRWRVCTCCASTST